MADMKVHTQFWGLDPVFRAHVHLCIRDLHNVEVVPSTPGVYLHNSHPFTRVDIQGVLVRLVEKAQFFIYTVDDGTGVVNCLLWKPTPLRKPAGLSPALAAKMTEIIRLQEEGAEGFQLGDLVHIRGRLKQYMERFEIRAAYCVRVNDPNKETEKMMKVAVMYERCYNKQAVLPKGIAKIAFQGDPAKIDALYNLERTILSAANAKNILEFTKKDLFMLDDVQDLLKKIENVDHAIEQLLSNLESAGHLFKKTTLRNKQENTYIVTKNCKDLEKTVIETIKKWQPSADFEDDCPAQHIYGVVHQLLPYSRLEMCTLSRCLEKLESQSDIISTADKCYITFNGI